MDPDADVRWATRLQSIFQMTASERAKQDRERRRVRRAIAKAAQSGRTTHCVTKGNCTDEKFVQDIVGHYTGSPSLRPMCEEEVANMALLIVNLPEENPHRELLTRIWTCRARKEPGEEIGEVPPYFASVRVPSIFGRETIKES